MTARKPTALKIMNGSAAQHPERLNPDEPMPEIGAEPPPWLPRRGVAWTTWNRLRPMLESTRILTVHDAEALALGCMALRDYLATNASDEHWRRRDAAWKTYWRMLQDFGMTPASRAKVHVIKPPVVDPVEEWRKAK